MRPTSPVFHHIALRVSGIENSLRFYQDIFGFQELRRYEGPGPDDKIVHLAQPGSRFVLELIAGDGSATSATHLAFHEPKFDEFLSFLREQGITLIDGPRQVGQEIVCFIKDPDGFLIEINSALP